MGVYPSQAEGARGAVDLDLRPFQRRFLADVLAPGVRTAALSIPRGNGKSTLVASLAARTLAGDRPATRRRQGSPNPRPLTPGANPGRAAGWRCPCGDCEVGRRRGVRAIRWC